MNSRQRQENGYSAGMKSKNIDGFPCLVAWSGPVWFVSINNPLRRNLVGVGYSEDDAVNDWREKMGKRK